MISFLSPSSRGNSKSQAPSNETQQENLQTVFTLSYFQGNPGVPVHLAGQQRGGRHGRPQSAFLHLPFGALCQLPALVQCSDRPAVVGALRCGIKFRWAAAHRHGAVMSGAGGDGQVRLEELWAAEVPINKYWSEWASGGLTWSFQTPRGFVLAFVSLPPVVSDGWRGLGCSAFNEICICSDCFISHMCRRQQKEEEEELERILQLSLTEK